MKEVKDLKVSVPLWKALWALKLELGARSFDHALRIVLREWNEYRKQEAKKNE